MYLKYCSPQIKMANLLVGLLQLGNVHGARTQYVYLITKIQ